ncbi:heavy metal translocating P-type ATPase [Fodinibius salsisoli]|uniref:Heavy metal translocating P-type ATPase n=1 Tax=Fodinibius salsisoli TaxID=2820877 RepID=A0ABT3PJX7_9BACT|nr:heavy metal translocating P-type ATPase [Fodinibius salsisoli]MCW9706245.1 heavy metal translocating P-type ATPase [Fodinibius salsisoli]
MQTLQLHIGGMACSFCAQSIDKAIGQREGVKKVNVSLAHEQVLIEYDSGDIKEPNLKQILLDLGYTIRDPDKVKAFQEQQQELKTHRNRLLVAFGLTLAALVIMIMMWSGVMAWWHPWATFVLALATMFGPGWYIKKKAWQSLRRGILNQHNLLEFGAFSGLIGGIAGLYNPAFPATEFFGVSVFITTYHILSGWSANKVRARASESVRKLLDLQPDTARRVDEDGNEREVEIDQLDIGDQVRIRPGENIPVDGEILEGRSGVDESIVTGESIPMEKGGGDTIVGGSINQTGTLLVQVTALGDDSFLNQIARHIEEARAMKPGIIQLVDRVLKYYVPGVVGFAIVSILMWTLGLWLITGQTNLPRGIFAMLDVFVLGYPCALGMATPLAMIRGGGMAADRGILMRSGEAFQIMKDIDTVVLDKTGTLTIGEPKVVDVLTTEQTRQNDFLRLAGAAEQHSEHPLAQAVVNYAKNEGESLPEAEEFDSTTGKGIRADIEGQTVILGSLEYLEQQSVEIPADTSWISDHEDQGHTVIAMATGGRLSGLFALADTLKADANETVGRLKDQDRNLVLLTGDNERTARAIAEQVGIEQIEARVQPDQKAERIRDIQEQDKRVAMVGDGINDAPALTQADVGMAIGTGTDIAIESADVILMGERLYALVEAFEIGGNSFRKTKQNLLLAFSFNGIGVPLATTGLLYPVWAMIAMVASVTAVLANSFWGRLISKASKYREEQKEQQQTITYRVPNMHCEHCVETINKTLTQRFENIKIQTDLEQHEVTVAFTNGNVNDSSLREALVEIGFKPEK